MSKILTFIKRHRYSLLLSLIIILGMAVNSPAINGDFLEWDDTEQITKNFKIQTWDLVSVKQIFTSFCTGMYQPLASLSFAVEYHLVGDKSWLYHLDNLLLHGLNIFLVFELTLLMFKRKKRALAAALIFAIWPTQVEAVAWMSARSTLLSAGLLLGTAISYLKYLENKKNKYLVVAFLLFGLACGTKAVSASFAVILFLFDYLTKRKISWKLFLEKLPFFGVSVVTGLVAIMARKSVDTLTFSIYNTKEKIELIFYTASKQLIKTLWPYGCYTFYEHPLLHTWVTWLQASLMPLVIIWGFIKRANRLIVFGLAWFIINISLSIQLAPYITIAGADRYNYLALLGIWWIIIAGIEKLEIKKYAKARYTYPAIGLIIGLLIFESVSLAITWQNDYQLWSRVVEFLPASATGHSSKASGALKLGKNTDAFAGANMSLALNGSDASAWNIRGMIFMTIIKNYSEATRSFHEAILLQPDNAIYYYNRGLALAYSNYQQLALIDMAKAKKISLEKRDKEGALSSILMSQAKILINLKRNGEAREVLKELIALYPGNQEAIDLLTNYQ